MRHQLCMNCIDVINKYVDRAGSCATALERVHVQPRPVPNECQVAGITPSVDGGPGGQKRESEASAIELFRRNGASDLEHRNRVFKHLRTSLSASLESAR